jgi:AraC family transcriptional regulator of arabinose operon
MDYPKPTPAPPALVTFETPHKTAAPLVTGHFRAGPGYSAYRRHGTRDWLLIYTMDGLGRFGYDGGALIVEAGMLVLLKPGTLHDYGVEPKLRRWELLWAHFLPRTEWLPWMEWPQVVPGLMCLDLKNPARRQIARRLRDVHRLAFGPWRRRQTLAINALEEVLLWCDQLNPRAEGSVLDPRLQAAIDYIGSNLGQKLDLTAVARAARLSLSRFAHLFREQVGLTPQRFIEQQRLERARQLLERTAMPVKSIAYEVGFTNPFYFSLRFKRYTGKSPSGFRAQ